MRTHGIRWSTARLPVKTGIRSFCLLSAVVMIPQEKAQCLFKFHKRETGKRSADLTVRVQGALRLGTEGVLVPDPHIVVAPPDQSR